MPHWFEIMMAEWRVKSLADEQAVEWNVADAAKRRASEIALELAGATMRLKGLKEHRESRSDSYSHAIPIVGTLLAMAFVGALLLSFAITQPEAETDYFKRVASAR